VERELEERYKVLLVSPEVAPFAKVGGLADVCGSLPKALAMLGNDVRVVMPRYQGIDDVRTITDFPVDVGGRRETAILREGVIRAQLHGRERFVPVYFIDNYHYFDREGIYGFWDEAERYAFFCRAVLQMLPKLNWWPDIIHCNDWATGPIPLLLRDQYGSQSLYSRIATVFTIHNLQYQGNFPREVLGLLHLGDGYYHPDRLEFYGQVSYMKAGLLYADMISTVSRTYAREIQRADQGHGMDGVLRMRAFDLMGIVNGINYHEFNPQTDPRLVRNYGPGDLPGKRENKYALQKELNLPPSDGPLLGMVTRLVDQKGLDLVADSMDELLRQDVQFVLLGSGDRHYEDLFRQIQRAHPEQAAVVIGFNIGLAQRIYAASDLFLMPSRFEPCGLGQLISLRYGAIPVVRATGGLADTISDYDGQRGSGNGFSFKDYSATALQEAVGRALDLYHDPERWRRLVENAMAEDHSWNRSAAEYMGLYQMAINKKRQILISA
jgi:starch synthase